MFEVVKLTGFKEFQALLQKLPGKIAEKVVAQAAFAGAKVIRDDAKQRAPLGTVPHYRSFKGKRGALVQPGNLRREIRARKAKREKWGEVRYKVGMTGRAFYGRFLEFGTRKMAARPWLRPAFDNNTNLAIEAQRLAFRRGIEREALKLGWRK